MTHSPAQRKQIAHAPGTCTGACQKQVSDQPSDEWELPAQQQSSGLTVYTMKDVDGNVYREVKTV